MPKITFKGALLPPSIRLNIEGIGPIRMIQAGGDTISGFTFADFTIKVKDFLLEVECEVNKYEGIADQTILLMHAYNLARAVVDSLCFIKGIGLTVYIESVVNPNGKERILGPQTDRVSGLCTAFTLEPTSYSAMVMLLISEPRILIALNDLVASISSFHLASINCARAVEAIRTAMAPETMDRNDAWLLVQKNLNVSKAYTQFITSESRGPRTHLINILVGGICKTGCAQGVSADLNGRPLGTDR